MSLWGLFALLISVTALLAYVNERWVRLPPTIGVMAASLTLSLAIALAGRLGLIDPAWADGLVAQLDFDDVLMRGMLSFLLFAGALHVDLGQLMQRRWAVLSMATLGVLISTLLVGGAFWLLSAWLGLGLSFGWALVFGALISPTDPIAVLGILRQAGAPRDLEIKIVGESLLNDGVGVVIFAVLVGLAAGDAPADPGHVALLLAEEALGGVLFGLALGYGAYRLLRTVDNYTVEILLTLALVAGGYALAGALHTSGPLAMVVAGLFIGNRGRTLGMSERSRQRVDTFWELIDEVLNALLFVMIGLEVLVLRPAPAFLVAGVLAIPLVLAARLISVGLPITVLGLFRSYRRGTVGVLTWGGIRGGISIALALSLPASTAREPILVATYLVVVFSILVQGLSLGRVVAFALRRDSSWNT